MEATGLPLDSVQICPGSRVSPASASSHPTVAAKIVKVELWFQELALRFSPLMDSNGVPAGVYRATARLAG